MITLKVKVRKGELRKENEEDVIVVLHKDKTVLKVFVSPEFRGEIPERADIITEDGKIHLVPEKEKDERLFIIDAIKIFSLKFESFAVELDEKMTTACIKKKRRYGGDHLEAGLAYAAILDFGEKIVSREYSHYRRVVSYSKENGLEVFNIDCRDKAKFPH